MFLEIDEVAVPKELLARVEAEKAKRDRGLRMQNEPARAELRDYFHDMILYAHAFSIDDPHNYTVLTLRQLYALDVLRCVKLSTKPTAEF